MPTITTPFSIWQPVLPNFFPFGDKDELADIPRRKVWEGTIESDPTEPNKALEALFEQFNLHHPAGFRGHSLSVNDCVVLGETTFRCASMGWEPQHAPVECLCSANFTGPVPTLVRNEACSVNHDA